MRLAGAHPGPPRASAQGPATERAGRPALVDQAHGGTPTQNAGGLPGLSPCHSCRTDRATGACAHGLANTGEPGTPKGVCPVRGGADRKGPTTAPRWPPTPRVNGACANELPAPWGECRSNLLRHRALTERRRGQGCARGKPFPLTARCPSRRPRAVILDPYPTLAQRPGSSAPRSRHGSKAVRVMTRYLLWRAQR